ncbi:MAG: PAS domain S-box protein [Spirochaetia bacterium]
MSKKILLVEDEALIAMAEAQMLEEHGYEVVTAYNGESAIEAVDSDPDILLILMDIDLGKGMDGTEAAEQILNRKDIPVVFLSSHTEPEVVEKTEKITSYGYVVKDSGANVLDASIKMAFRLFDARMKEKEHKEALLHSHNLLSYIIEHNQSAVAVHDRDLKYIYVSKQYLNQYNVEKRDIIGKHHYEVFPDLPQKWREIHKRALAGEVSKGEDDPYEHEDGTIAWTRWECRPWYEADGTIGGFVLYTEVVSKERQTQFEVRDNTNYLQSILRTTPDGFWVLDTDGNFIDVNKAYCEMSGYSRDEILRLKVPDIDADERPRDTAERMKRIITTGSEMFQTRHRRKDGSIFDVEVSASFLGGEQDKFVCFCRDITERKQTAEALREREENLRITLNSIGDAVIATDIEGAVIRMNPVAESLCGWNIHEAKGKPLKEVFRIVNADTGVKVENPVAKVLETGNIIGLANHTMLISKDGTEYQIADSAAPVRDDTGLTTGVVLVFRDVTEEYEKERQLQKRVKELRSIEWMLSNKTTRQEEYVPEYGDLSELNTGGLILHSVGKEQLKDIASEYLDLLETSTAVYEKDGAYALGVFSSGWCRLMDSASRRLCNTEDNREALESGKWLCHESCWNDAVLAMSEDKPGEVECNGGIKMYGVPVHAGGETVGAINFGYGSPPTDKAKLEALSQKYKIPVDELMKQAEAYNPRPQFIIDYAKERIQVAAAHLGRIINLKRKEEELAKKTTLLEESQELAHLGSWEWDIINDTWTFSKQWKQIHGVSDNILKRSGLLEIAHPEDAPYIEKAFSEAKEEGKQYNIQHRIIRADNNETRYIHAVGVVEYNRNTGRPLRMIGTAQDITERKQAEKELRESELRFRTLADSGQALVWTSGIDKDCDYFNRPWLEFTGRTLDEELGSGWIEGVHADDRDRCIGTYIAAFDRREPFSMSYRLRRADGEFRWIQDDGTPRYDSHGEFLGYIGHCLDITDLKEAEDKLREGLKEKEFLMKELNHRVKNSLLMVSSLIKLKDSETENDLSDIQHQIEAVGLIHEKLYQTGNVKEICCRDYISDLLNSIFSSFSRRPVRIEADVEEICIPTQSAMSLGLIINEIATNAIKHGFSDTEEPVFSVSLKKDKENNQYKLTLSNTGNPFPEDIDLDNPQTLGLRLLSALTEQLGGTIELERRPRPVFNIRFPIGEE